jgi:lactoylglutathione lyase
MTTTATRNMDLGNFSISLSVKDLAASRAFYEKLGFVQIGGDASQNWLILRNGQATIGLFHGMFEGNIFTFNPGWDREGSNVDPFMDVREIQRILKQRGIELTSEADQATTGPAHITLVDPDGNAIMIDQHR